MQFGPGSTSVAVPQLANVFVGDEAAHAVRLFSYGYNVYSMAQSPVYHLYVRHKHGGVVEYLHHNLQESPQLKKVFDMFYERSISAVQRLLSGNDAAPLGPVRSLADFKTQFSDSL